MSYLVPDDPNDDADNFTVDYWMLESGPFGVSGFNMDGIEIGKYCYICDAHCVSIAQSRIHYEGKRHAQKVKLCRKPVTEFVIEPSTGGDLNDPENLFLPDRCKVCDAELSTQEQQEGHYMSEKHQKKVRHYFLVKIGAREQSSAKPIEVPPEERDFSKLTKQEYCALCKVELSAPVVARAHYAGKKHAKKVREKIEMESNEPSTTLWHKCDVCDVRLNSEQQYTQHLQSAKHLKLVEKSGVDFKDIAKRSTMKRREEIEHMLKEDEAKRRYLSQELEGLKKLEELHESL